MLVSEWIERINKELPEKMQKDGIIQDSIIQNYYRFAGIDSLYSSHKCFEKTHKDEFCKLVSLLFLVNYKTRKGIVNMKDPFEAFRKTYELLKSL